MEGKKGVGKGKAVQVGRTGGGGKDFERGT